MYLVKIPLASGGKGCFGVPATVFVSVAWVKFFASLRVAHIWRLKVKAALVFIDHSEYFCGGFSENLNPQSLQSRR
jgi:hypothetical protein